MFGETAAQFTAAAGLLFHQRVRRRKATLAKIVTSVHPTVYHLDFLAIAQSVRDDRRALAGEFFRDRQSDAAGGPGDQCPPCRAVAVACGSRMSVYAS